MGADVRNYPNWVQLYDFSYNNGNSQFSIFWKLYYRGISFCNQIIDKVGNMSDKQLNDTDRKQLLAEAHFLRGFYHMQILLNWEKIIIRDKLADIYPEEAEADKKKFRHVHKVPTQGIVLLVREGDEVQCGDKLCDAQVNSREVLTVQGETAVLSFLVKAIQDVYREQDIEINEKHLSIIIRQMLRTVEIVRSNDTNFIENQKVDKIEFLKENEIA